MIAEISILCIAAAFLIVGIFLFNGKGKWLIAGYNTASKEDREKYDEKKLCKGNRLPLHGMRRDALQYGVHGLPRRYGADE